MLSAAWKPRGQGTACLGLVVVLAVASSAACSRPIQHARISVLDPGAPAELEAAERLAKRRCSGWLGYVYPGLALWCVRRDSEAVVVAGAATAELAAGIAVASTAPEGLSHPGAFMPLVGVQDAWVYGLAQASIDDALARQALYAPRDSLLDLAAAPFNWEVIKRPDVWLGAAALLGLGIAASAALDGWPGGDELGDTPNVFGKHPPAPLGYSVGAATGVALFTHVAIAEEALFRGVIQSGIARSNGETAGWIWGSLIFGVTHSLNALELEGEERKKYLLYGVPFITGVGSYLGYLYRRADYSLAPPAAVHFWYDFLLSATFFALDPENSPISAKVSIPF